MLTTLTQIVTDALRTLICNLACTDLLMNPYYTPKPGQCDLLNWRKSTKPPTSEHERPFSSQLSLTILSSPTRAGFISSPDCLLDLSYRSSIYSFHLFCTCLLPVSLFPSLSFMTFVGVLFFLFYNSFTFRCIRFILPCLFRFSISSHCPFHDISRAYDQLNVLWSHRDRLRVQSLQTIGLITLAATNIPWVWSAGFKMPIHVQFFGEWFWPVK